MTSGSGSRCRAPRRRSSCPTARAGRAAAAWADRDAAEAPMSGDTRSVIGSITKTFVAALILQLVEEGRLSLKSRLSSWFPEYPFASSIRVRNLLRHTSGLADYFSNPDYARLVYRRPDHQWTPAEILGLVRPQLLFPPGHGWSYSNTNYLFLGLIAERVTGHDLETELRRGFSSPTAWPTPTSRPASPRRPAPPTVTSSRSRASWAIRMAVGTGPTRRPRPWPGRPALSSRRQTTSQPGRGRCMQAAWSAAAR